MSAYGYISSKDVMMLTLYEQSVDTTNDDAIWLFGRCYQKDEYGAFQRDHRLDDRSLIDKPLMVRLLGTELVAEPCIVVTFNQVLPQICELLAELSDNIDDLKNDVYELNRGYDD